MDLVDRLAGTRIGSTHNQYAHSLLRRERLRTYLEEHASAAVILVGELPKTSTGKIQKNVVRSEHSKYYEAG